MRGGGKMTLELELEKLKNELLNTKDIGKEVTINITEYEYRILEYFQITIEGLIRSTVNQIEYEFLMTDEEKEKLINEILANEKLIDEILADEKQKCLKSK